MTPCQELADWLLDLVSGELTPEQQGACRDHLAVCPPCLALLESYRVVVVLGRQLPALPLPDRVWARLEVAVRGAAGEAR